MKYLNEAGGRFKLPLKDNAGKTVATLLWGDPLPRCGSRRTTASGWSSCAATSRGRRCLTCPAQIRARRAFFTPGMR
ncbi:MAG TPA: hypothetical protein PKH69_04730 [Thiobacillaceae bacterium]|nr:hypothetical protein [Thiobacillaceae bacterium]HNU64963.1 hypothetical protein [Thiobacillaceae bacterium]